VLLDGGRIRGSLYSGAVSLGIRKGHGISRRLRLLWKKQLLKRILTLKMPLKRRPIKPSEKPFK
jgi:hypothetical protein